MPYLARKQSSHVDEPFLLPPGLPGRRGLRGRGELLRPDTAWGARKPEVGVPHELGPDRQLLAGVERRHRRLPRLQAEGDLAQDL